MSGHLRDDERGARGVRRIIRDQIDKVREALGDGRPDDEAVHDARKGLKKARAALRLLRKALGSRAYRQENASLRDAARPLTELRDAKVLVDALDELVKRSEGEVDAGAVAGVREALLGEHQEVRRVLEDGAALAPVHAVLKAVRRRSKDWPVGRRRWSVLGNGLKRVYRAGRDAFAEAREGPSDEAFHEWRKQVKYLWHQLQFLRPIRPELLDEMAEQAHALADRLGDDHDLAVLREKLQGLSERTPDRAAAVGPLLAQLDRRRAELQGQAHALGEQIYARKPKAFVGRLKRLWRDWRDAPAAAGA